ncbi:lysosomal Pro-X carboxypeptidase isoform X2 [Fagus crenata]
MAFSTVEIAPGGSRSFTAASLYYNYSHTEKCFNLENQPDAHCVRGWNWQFFGLNSAAKLTQLNPVKPHHKHLKACTEMVMPMTCSNESMFPPSGFDYKEFVQQCMKRYGVLPRPHWITTEYGGKKIEHVLKRFGSNIIFSNGMQDPWSRGGVLKNISSSIVALVTKKDDPNWLIEQRRVEIKIIQD